MKTLWEIMSWVSRKERFEKIEDYLEFSKYYLEFIEKELQAVIIAQNEHNYHFFQYQRDGEYNITRPVNGDLFERLIQLTMRRLGFSIDTETLSIQVPGSQETMKYQNDIEMKVNGKIVAIGSVKTSSKDRIDKIFLDKLMYNRLTQTNTPHFAIFLHDVQRAGKEPDFRVGQTFLTGHFKAYTVGLSPLDGVYYCDLRPVMKADQLLREHIKSLDCLLCEDAWKYL